MALQLQFNRESTGDEYPDAYHRILGLYLEPAQQRAKVIVGIYRDSQARTDEKQPVEIMSYRVEPDEYKIHFKLSALNGAGANPYKRAYEYLKRLPEYEGALDA